MAQDWKDIPEDTMLNFREADTGLMAKYERILNWKTKIAIDALAQSTRELKASVNGVGNKIERGVADVISAQDRLASAESKHRWAIGFLTAVIAASTVAYTWVTWQQVRAVREANDLQRSSIELRRASPQEPAAQD